MSKIQKKYIGTAQVGAVQIRLENDQALVSRNAANTVDVDILKLDTSDQIQVLRPLFLSAEAGSGLEAVAYQQVLLLDGSNPMAADINMGTFLITDLGDPTADQDAATKIYVDTAVASIDISGKANTNLDNLATSTSIPATTVSLRSLNTTQVLATEFKLETADQTTSNSGSVRVRAGNVDGNFVSGAARMLSGFNTNALRATAATAATGLVSVGSGSITGGTTGSTGAAFLSTGTITGTVSGNTGAVTVSSGTINSTSTGNTGDVIVVSGTNSGVGVSGNTVIETGNSVNAAGGNTGTMFVDTGRSLNGVSGPVFIQSGAVSNVPRFPGDLDNIASTQPTGVIAISSGNILNASSSAATGGMSFASGSHSGVGTSGNVNINSGANTGTGGTGSLNLNSGNSAASSSGSVNIASGTTGGIFSSGGVNISSGATTGADSGLVQVTTGDTAGNFITGGLNLFTGNNTNAARANATTTATGNILMGSGDVAAGTGRSGYAGISTGVIAVGATGNSGESFLNTGLVAGTGRTGDVSIYSGENTGTGDTGDIYIFTGDAAAGTSGKLNIFCRIVEIESQVDMQGNKIIDLADPTNPQDAATKTYVDSQIAAGVNFKNELVTLNGTDITNQYIDLSQKYMPDSIMVSCSRVVLNAIAAVNAAYDFQVDNSGLVTRLIFQGPSASAGAEALVDGDVLFIKAVVI